MYPASLVALRASVAPAAYLLFGLLAVDAMLLGLHMCLVAGVISDVRFAITTERGVPETVQYAKAAAAAWLLLDVFSRTRSLTALIWSAGLLAILVDDAAAIHERTGATLGPLLFPAGLGPLAPRHAAEFLVLGAGAALFAVAVAAVSAREGRRGWAITTALGGALALLAGFAIFADALQSSASSTVARRTLAIVEDGGEMVAMTATVAIAWTLAAHVRASRST